MYTAQFILRDRRLVAGVKQDVVQTQISGQSKYDQAVLQGT